jgi:ArsR family transcriptional regulator, arsenate/arsenite/antimonite-responsive transcriptional repressor
MNKMDVLKALGALAHEVRLDVYRKLVVAGPGGMTPKVLSEQLDVPPTKLSFHLKELAIAGLVTHEQDGRYLIYRAAYDRMDGLVGYLTENCCKCVPVADTAEAGSCSC